MGRARFPRLEDEALLRGEGRFIDDLDPVANARHAAVASLAVRSRPRRAARSRAPHSSFPASSAFSPAPTSPPCRGPSPRGSTRRCRTTPPRTRPSATSGEPVAVVVARDRYLAEDALELIEVEYESLDPVLDAETAAETDACVSDRSFHYGDVDAALAEADLVVRERFRFPRWSCTPVECYGVVADWSHAEDR